MRTISRQKCRRLCCIIDTIHTASRMGCHTDCVNARVRPAPSSHLFELLGNVLIQEIQRLSFSLLPRQVQSLRHVVDSNDVLSTEHVRTLDRELPDRSAPPYCYSITFFTIA